MITLFLKNGGYPYRTDKVEQKGTKYVFTTVLKSGAQQIHELDIDQVSEKVEDSNITVKEYWNTWREEHPASEEEVEEVEEKPLVKRGRKIKVEDDGE